MQYICNDPLNSKLKAKVIFEIDIDFRIVLIQIYPTLAGECIDNIHWLRETVRR